MRIVATYSFNGGEETIQKHYAEELREITQIFSLFSIQECKTERTKGKAKSTKPLYNSQKMNRVINGEFAKLGWRKQEISEDYPTEYYVDGYNPPATSKRMAMKIDFTKNHLGVDIALNKKGLPIYSGCAKMTIFHNMGHIDVGIEIVPVKELAEDMSSGVSYFEQFVWDLEKRGVSDIDIPVLILGVAP